MSTAEGPATRTTPMPPRPAGVAIATIVSDVEKPEKAGKATGLLRGLLGDDDDLEEVVAQA